MIPAEITNESETERRVSSVCVYETQLTSFCRK